MSALRVTRANTARWPWVVVYLCGLIMMMVCAVALVAMAVGAW